VLNSTADHWHVCNAPLTVWSSKECCCCLQYSVS